MLRFKHSHVFLLLGLIAPIYSYAATNYCVAVNSGFGSGGTSFVGSGFTIPAAGTCTPWSGFAKTASTVILTTTGTGCLSTNGRVLTLSLLSTDPAFLGAGTVASDYIQFCPTAGTCPFGTGGGSDQGTFGGPAVPMNCKANWVNLPPTHD